MKFSVREKVKISVTAVVLLLALCLIISFAVHQWEVYTSGIKGVEINDFVSYKSDFQHLSDLFRDYFDKYSKEDGELVRIAVTANADSFDLACIYAGENESRIFREKFDEKTEKAVSRMHDAFLHSEYQGLTLITVYSDCVVFNRAGLYSLINTKLGKDPRHTDFCEDGEDYVVDMAWLGWYHVKEK